MRDLYVDMVVVAYWHCNQCDVRGASPQPGEVLCWYCKGHDVRIVAEDMERQYVDPGKLPLLWRRHQDGEGDRWI